MTMTWKVRNGSVYDLSIKNGKLLLADGAEEVMQRVLITLQHHWQEYFLNVQAGLPWAELILGSKNKQLVEALIRRAVLDVPNVVSIIGLQTVWQSGTEARSLDLYLDLEVVTRQGLQTISVKSNLGE